MRLSRRWVLIGMVVIAILGASVILFPSWFQTPKGVIVLLTTVIVTIISFAADFMQFVMGLRDLKLMGRARLCMVDPPMNFVDRPKEYEDTVLALVSPIDGRSKSGLAGIAVALIGAGGYGKTTLAQKVCHDPRVKIAFPYGVLLVELGERPTKQTLISKIEDLIYEIEKQRPGFTELTLAAAHLRQLLKGKRALLVIDDAWREQDLKPFLEQDSKCACLVTTRNKDILPLKTVQINVGAMKPQEAIDLLLTEFPKGEEEALRFLASRIGNWPVLLEIVNRVLRGRTGAGESAQGAITFVKQALDQGGITAFDVADTDQRNKAAGLTIEVSLELLEEEERLRFYELAVFPADTDIPLDLVAALWKETGGFQTTQSELLCKLLADRSLIRIYDLRERKIRLHDVILHYLLEKKASGLKELHQKVLEAYREKCLRGWSAGPEDGYYFRWLAYHLAHAGQLEDLERLLLDFDWISAHLRCGGINELLGDYEVGLGVVQVDKGDISLVQEALRLSAHVLAMDADQLGGQLLGRLLLLKSDKIKLLLEQAKRHIKHPWLRPVVPCLPSPGGSEINTLIGHTSGILSLYISKDGLRLVSCSIDNSVKLWDLSKPKFLRSIPIGVPINKQVCSAIILKDGHEAICGYQDGTIKKWDLDTESVIKPFRGFAKPIDAFAITPDESRIVTIQKSSEKQIISIWNLKKSKNFILPDDQEEEIKNVTSLVEIFPDGHQFIYNSNDHFYIRSLETGQIIWKFIGNAIYATCISVSPDGKHAFSGYYDGTIRVWDLYTGLMRCKLQGHSSSVKSIAIFPDGCHAISGSSDGTLAVWDILNGTLIRTVKSLSGAITTISVNSQSATAVSGFESGAIKIWNAQKQQSEREIKSHGCAVNCLSVSKMANRFLSGSSDKTIKLWEGKREIAVQTLTGHTNPVTTVAIDPSGCSGLSGSAGRIFFWDFNIGQAIAQNNLPDRIQNLIIRSDGDSYVSVLRNGTVMVQDLRARNEPIIYKLNTGAVQVMAITPDGNRVIIGSDDFRLKLWDIKGYASAFMLEEHFNTTALAISRDGNLGVAGDINGNVMIWNLSNLHKNPTKWKIGEIKAHTEYIQKIDISSNNRLLITGAGDIIKIWDLHSRECCMKFVCNSKVNTFSLATNDKILFVGDLGGSVYSLELVGV